MSGLDLQEKFAGLGNRLPIGLRTGHSYAGKSMKHGTTDFLFKRFGIRILDAIATTVQREISSGLRKAPL
jgi:FixJ family two-component response regulator